MLKYFYTNVQSSTILNNQKMKTTQTPLTVWVDEQNVAYVYLYKQHTRTHVHTQE